MKLSYLNPFTIKRRMKERRIRKIADKEYRIVKENKKLFDNIDTLHSQIKTNVNPFLYVQNNKKEIHYIDDIEVTIENVSDSNTTIKNFFKNPYLNLKQKKNIIDNLIKVWEYQYYQDIDEQLKKILEKASYNPVKKFYKIKNSSIYFYMLLALTFLVLLRQYSSLQLIPFIGILFKWINTLFLYNRYYNFASAIVYLSIVISMYLIIVKVYFDKVLKYGMSAKGFLIKERDRMLKKFNPTKSVFENI